jgi:tetratricopeptide (TPR) repeat protein
MIGVTLPLRSVVAGLFGFAAFTALRSGAAEIAFQQDTAASLQRAEFLQPASPNEMLERRLADLDPAQSGQRLERIVRFINPRSSAAWIELGLAAEARGNAEEAEGDLRQAAQIDRQFAPAWTLANFYFRQGRGDAFWPWAARAADLSVDRLAYSDLAPLLQLADSVEADPDKMLAHFPSAVRLRPAYLSFLMGSGRLNAAQKVALEMRADRANAPHLLDLADRQIQAGNPAAALEVWNASSGLGPLDPQAGRVLSNGDLAQAPLNLGFDWRLTRLDGVDPGWRPSELEFHLSNRNAAPCWSRRCFSPRNASACASNTTPV